MSRFRKLRPRLSDHVSPHPADHVQTVKQHLQRSVLKHAVAFRPFTRSDEPTRLSERSRAIACRQHRNSSGLCVSCLDRRAWPERVEWLDVGNLDRVLFVTTSTVCVACEQHRPPKVTKELRCSQQLVMNDLPLPMISCMALAR